MGTQSQGKHSSQVMPGSSGSGTKVGMPKELVPVSECSGVKGTGRGGGRKRVAEPWAQAPKNGGQRMGKGAWCGARRQVRAEPRLESKRHRGVLPGFVPVPWSVGQRLMSHLGAVVVHLVVRPAPEAPKSASWGRNLGRWEVPSADRPPGPRLPPALSFPGTRVPRPQRQGWACIHGLAFSGSIWTEHKT